VNSRHKESGKARRWLSKMLQEKALIF